MRRFSILLLVLSIHLFSRATIKTWIGGSSGNWNNTSNWSSGIVPILGDDVIFNSSATVVIDLGLSPISLNSIHFINNSTVLFQCGETSNFRLFSTSVANPALLIEAGSIFTFDETNSGINNSTLDLSVVSGCIGSIAGTLNMSGTGAGVTTAGTKLDTYTSSSNYGIVTVYNGGKIRILPGADNTESSLLPVPTIIMQAGSSYENLKNGGSFPEGNWATTSLARALSPGTIAPSFNGVSYGDLEWNCINQNNFSLASDISFNNVNLINTKSGASAFRIINTTASIRTLTINGNLDISSSAVLEITGSGTASSGGGKLHLLGNLNNQGIIKSSGVAGTVNEFELDGTSNQNIKTTDIIGPLLEFIIKNPAGATLLSPVILPRNLQLLSGKIKTTSVNLLTLKDNANYTGGSSTSFVEGPMKKIGDEDFIFPVGVGSMYCPLGISGGANAAATDQFTAEYKRTNPQSLYGTNYAAGINHVSYVEYWQLDRNVGAATKNVSLAVNTTSFCYKLANTFISKWNGSQWTNEPSSNGGITSTPPYEIGTLTTNTPIPNFSPFTLATNLSFNANPLPINLISFDAKRTGSGNALLKWELAAPCSDAATFEIEKSTDGRTFIISDKINGNSITRFYSLTDNQLSKGSTFYRLKMIDENGAITYNKIVAVINDKEGLLITGLWPNPVQGTMNVIISSAKAEQIHFSAMDLSGKIVKQWNSNVTEGTNDIQISTENFPAGMYQLLITGNTNRIAYRFIKQ